MKLKPGFGEGVLLAVLLSVGGAALFVMFAPFFAPGFMLRALISATGFCYLVYLLWRSRTRVGRATVVAGWIVISAGSGFLLQSFAAFLFIHLGMLWLARAFYYHDSIVSALLDLMLGITGLALAIAAGLHTRSVFVALWVFYLCQALFVFLPRRIGKSRTYGPGPDLSSERFERAHRAALAAVRKLSTVK